MSAHLYRPNGVLLQLSADILVPGGGQEATFLELCKSNRIVILQAFAYRHVLSGILDVDEEILVTNGAVLLRGRWVEERDWYQTAVAGDTETNRNPERRDLPDDMTRSEERIGWRTNAHPFSFSSCCYFKHIPS